MNFLKMLIVTLVVALGIYTPSLAQSQQERSGSIIIILEGRMAQQFDYQFSSTVDNVEKQLLIFDDMENCIYDQYFTTEIVTVGMHELNVLPYRFFLLVGDQKMEGEY